MYIVVLTFAPGPFITTTSVGMWLGVIVAFVLLFRDLTLLCFGLAISCLVSSPRHLGLTRRVFDYRYAQESCDLVVSLGGTRRGLVLLLSRGRSSGLDVTLKSVERSDPVNKSNLY
jgi:hypothetical protein